MCTGQPTACSIGTTLSGACGSAMRGDNVETSSSTVLAKWAPGSAHTPSTRVDVRLRLYSHVRSSAGKIAGLRVHLHREIAHHQPLFERHRLGGTSVEFQRLVVRPVGADHLHQRERDVLRTQPRSAGCR